MFTVAVIGCSVLAILFFIAKGESYKKQVSHMEREVNHAKQDASSYLHLTEFSVGELCQMYKEQLKQMKNNGLTLAHDDLSIEVIAAMPTVLAETLAHQSEPQAILENFIENNNPDKAELLDAYFEKQSEDVVKAWRSNSLSGYIRLCQHIMHDLQEKALSQS